MRAKSKWPSGSGGVAQLGERQLCKLNVVGSIPSTSTSKTGEIMLKKALLPAIIMIFCGGLSKAACTPEEAQAKAQEFMNAAIALAQKDPKKYQSVATVMQSELPELQKLEDMGKLCEFYDDWLAKMK